MSLINIPSGNVLRPDFDEEHHRYTLNGQRIPSVTQIMRPLTNLVYGKIDPVVLKQAADFGTAVHACTEFLDRGELDESSVEEEWQPFLNAYVSWKESVKPKILNIEERLACFTFAGTIDRVVVIDGELWIIDIKTTTEIHKHVGVQLAAYAALAEKAFGGFYRRAALQLKEDGSFKVQEFRSVKDERCFNSLIFLHHWLENGN